MDESQAEKEILSLIAGKDAAAFDRMVEHYGPMLYRYALRMCGEAAEAEDALQDTFLTAQQKIGQFRGEGKLRNWLFKITGNACLQRRRKNRGRLRTELRLDDVLEAREDAPEFEPAAWQQNSLDRLLSAELSARIEAGIAKVPAGNRAVLILRDLEGLSTRETAEALDLTEEAVKVRLHRARVFLRNLLRDYFEGKK